MTTAEPAAIPLPEVTVLTEPYWTGLAEGELRHQRCGSCGNAWLPAREECPGCLSDQIGWETGAGRGTLVSWVVYHQASHPGFAGRVPYNVAIVALDEGPRLITNLLDPAEDLRIDAAVELRIEQESGVALPRFALVR